MDIVIINLATETVRWETVRRQFTRLGLLPRRIDAVLGKTLSAQECKRLYSTELNRCQYYQPLLPGEIGCYASHLKVWEELVQGSEPCLAVFEDDVEIPPDLPQLLEAVAALDNSGWDMIKLMGRSTKRPRWQRPLLPGRDLVAFRRVPSLTGAYIVSRRGAEKLLAHRIPFGRPIDVDLRHWWECDLHILGIYPYPVKDAETSWVSSISGTDRETALLTRIRKALFKFKYSSRNLLANQAYRERHGKTSRPEEKSL